MYVGSVPAPSINSVEGNLNSFIVVIIPPTTNAICIKEFVLSILGSNGSVQIIIVPFRISSTVAVINYENYNLFPRNVVYTFRARVGINMDYSVDVIGLVNFTGE